MLNPCTVTADRRTIQTLEVVSSSPVRCSHSQRLRTATNLLTHVSSAAFEYYRFLGMLKSYRVLNRTGFTKVSYALGVRSQDASSLNVLP